MRHEKLWRKTKLTVHRQEYKRSCADVNDLIEKAKTSYFVKKIEDCESDQGKLFQIVDKLLGREKSSSLPEYTTPSAMGGTFNEFFVVKIVNLQTDLSKLKISTSDLNCPPVSSLLSSSASELHSFKPATTSEITSIIKKASNASCPLDPIPTRLLNDVLSVLSPIITQIVNASLQSGIFPSELKSAIVRPLLKKPSLDCEILKNYRPVSNLLFLSKVIEKVVASRLVDHMTENNLMDPMQSAYRKGHSTETALLRLHNDAVSAVDRGCGVCLVLLDLSAAFDTIDHTILLTFLKEHIGLGGPVLDLFQSYLSGRTQCISIEGVLSELKELVYGVPQGSVLGPLEFCIYTIPIGAILRHYKINYQIYADDTQLYCAFELESFNQVFSSIRTCISDIRSWMIKNKLKINDDKTELLIITSPHSKFATDLQLSIGQCEITPTSKCKSLGVMLDDHFDMDAQIKNICRSAHFHLRNIRAIRPLLPDSAAAQLVHSLVTSRLDYCNSLLNGVPGYRIHPLQRVQNIAARIVSRCSRDIDSEDVLQSLNWLPIKYRITFKVLLIVYKCVNDLAPKYLSDLFIPYKKDRTVRNNFKHLLDCPENRDAKSKSYGHRAFGFAGADMWNTLPLDIKLSSSVSVFKSKLKTHLFKQCYGLTN